MRSHILRLSYFALAAAGLCALADQPAALGQTVVRANREQYLDTVGEPKGFKAGEPARYALWISKKGSWHVRTTTAKKLHHFTGKIFVENGLITGLEPHTLEHKGKFADWWRINEKRQEIVIDFKTDRGVDGINFQVSPTATRVLFNLYIDGKHHPQKIFVGKKGLHPDADPFVTPAHPK